MTAFNNMGRRTKSKWEFWDRVDIKGPNDCWPWLGCVSDTGHGRLLANGQYHYTHRLALESRIGELPSWSTKCEVLHECNNARCCNPDHLRLGTRKENMEMAGAVGVLSRKRTQNGRAKLSEQQIATIKRSKKSGPTLAALYGVTRQQISRIKRGMQWA